METIKSINNIFYGMLGINFYIILVGVICYYLYNSSIILQQFFTGMIIFVKKHFLYDTLTSNERMWFEYNYDRILKESFSRRDWKTARKLKKLYNINTDDCYCYLLELLKMENIPE